MNRDRRIVYYLWGLMGLVAVFLVRRNLAAEWFLFTGQSYEDLHSQWADIFLIKPLSGFILSDFFDGVNSFLLLFLYLGLILKARLTKRVFPWLALLIGGLATLFYFLSSPAPALYSMARVLAVGPGGETAMDILEKADQLLLLHMPQTSVPGVYALAALFLFSLSGLGFSLLMLKVPGMKRWQCIAGIIAHLLALIYLPFPYLLKPWSFLPMTLSAPFMVTWHFCASLYLIKGKGAD